METRTTRDGYIHQHCRIRTQVVFPGLRVERMKSADVVKLVIMLLAGVITALHGYIFAEVAGWTVRSACQ